MTNLDRFCKQLGIQGGTVHQVADKLGVPVEQVLDAEFISCPKWAKGIKQPSLVSPCGDKVESVVAYHVMVKLYLNDGWKWSK